MPKVEDLPTPRKRHAQLFRNGRSQALRIPKEFEMPGKEVILHREGDRLIIEPLERKLNLLEILATLKPLDITFPDVDEGLLPLDDIR